MPSPKKPIILSLFWKTALILIIIGIVISLTFSSYAIDIQMHDTYVIISYGHVFLLISLLFLFSSALYLIALRHRYDNIDIAIVMIHYWTTILGLLILIFSKLYGSFDKQADYISFDKDVRESVAIIVVVLTCVITIQVAPIIIFVRKMF